MVSVACWACLLTSYSASTNSQNLDPATGLPLNSTSNVLNLGGGLPWTNTVTGEAGGYSGGYRPAYNPATGNIIFGYTTQTVSQTIGINAALSNAGAGVQLSGYRYLWQINNDLNNSGGNRGTLTGNVALRGPSGNLLESFNYNYSQSNLPELTSFSGIQLFNNRYDTVAASSLTVSFTGKDQNYWAGFYGPRVHVDSFNLLYTVDPCKLNPAYSPTCSGFNTIVTTGNLVPYPDAVSTSLTQVVAINTALKNVGFGATVHGFNYKFDYTVGQGFFGCTATNQDGSCSWWMNLPAYVSASASMTNSNNQTLISRNHSFNSEGTSGTVNSQLLLSSSMNQTSLGNIRLSGGSSGFGSYIGNYSMSLLYTPDPCAKDPLYSSQCSGYAQAMAAKLSVSTTPTSSTPTLEPLTASATIVTPVNISQPSNNSPSKSQTDNTTTNKGAPQSKILATALSIIAKNQQREQAIQNSAVQTATAEAVSAGEKAQQQAVTVATSLAIMSQQTPSASISTTVPTTDNKTVTSTVSTLSTSKISTPTVSSVSLSSVGSSMNNQTSSSPMIQNYLTRTQPVTISNQDSTSSTLPPQPPNNQSRTTVATQPTITTVTPTQNTSVFSQPTIEYQQTNIVTAYVQPQNTMFYTMVSNTITEQPQQTMTQLISLAKQAEIEQVNNTVSFMTNRTDPLNEIVEAKPTVTTTSTTESAQTVKAKVSDNELAGGVDINKMAIIPVGYSNYTNLMLKDGKLYEPKEIYKNQVPVDNARALRQLSTDRLHQQMIEQQYRR